MTSTFRTKNGCVTSNNDSIATPSGFVGINLYQHQGIMVNAMLIMESRRQSYKNDDPTKTNILIYTDKFGSGKTITTLALILARPIPTTIKENVTLTSQWLIPRAYNYLNLVLEPRFEDNKYLRPNLIIVLPSVLYKWRDFIENHTILKVFMIENLFSLNKFIEILNNGKVNEYDIVLAKHGKISTDDYADRGGNLILDIIAYHTKNPFARTIIDEYDSILPVRTHIPSGLAYLMISGSKIQRTNDQFTDFSKSSMTINSISWFVRSPEYDGFILRSSDELIQTSINIPSYDVYKYIISAPNAIRYIGMINDDANLMDMINANAYKTIAEKYKFTNVGNIFIDMFVANYKTMSALKNKIGAIMQFYSDLEVVDREIPEDDLIKLKNYILGQINAGKVPVLRENQFVNLLIKQEIDNVRNKCMTEATACSGKIDRVVADIKNGECHICSLEIKDLREPVVHMTHCCNLIFCKNCLVNACKITEYNKQGKCPKCLRKLIYTNIIINDTLLENIDNEIKNMCANYDNIYKELNEGDGGGDIPTDKVSAIMKIINDDAGMKAGRVKVDNYNINLITGTKHVPHTGARKILIFSLFDELLKNITKELEATGIKYLKLFNNARAIRNIVEDFKNSDIPILLINSSVHCAGIDLQFCSDVILTHSMKDGHIIAQSLARAQRNGRTSSLCIHEVRYDNETIIEVV